MIKIYTDGSSNGKTGAIGGWAFLIHDPREPNILWGRSGYKDDATNNRMELLAVLEGLKGSLWPETIEVITDSQLVVCWLTGKYRINDKNIGNLVEEIENTISHKNLKVSYTLVKGHSTCKENNYCDKMAKSARISKINSMTRITLSELDTARV